MTEKPRTPRKDARSEQDLVEAELNAIRDPALVDSRRDQLLDAALELFLEKGYASTTIRDICARSGINQASFYDYVANKQDILRRLLNRVWFRPGAPALSERLSGPDAPPLEEFLLKYLREGWTARRKGTLLAYRSVPHLDQQDRRTLWQREDGLVAVLTGYLARRAGCPPMTTGCAWRRTSSSSRARSARCATGFTGTWTTKRRCASSSAA